MATESVDIAKLARSYRRLVLWFGAQLLLNCGSFSLQALQGDSIAVAIVGLALLAGALATVIALAYYGFHTASALGSSVACPWSLKSGVLYAHAPAAALERLVALRVHLDDSLPENGPLRVLPGTHSLRVLSDAEIQDLAMRIRPHECPVARGGVISMRPLLVHASSKSLTASPRRVLHIEYAAAFDLGSELELDVA